MSPFNAKRQDCGRYKLLPQITALNITLEKTEEICLAAVKAEEDISRLEKDKKVQTDKAPKIADNQAPATTSPANNSSSDN